MARWCDEDRKQRIGWRPIVLSLLLAVTMSGCSSEKAASDGDHIGQKPSARQSAAKPATRTSPPMARRHFDQKLWIIGFDGVDPDWMEAWAKQGHLPNVRKLMESEGFYRLRSTNPPQSPVAWSSFATAANPGEHGIYDFIRRDPATYFPGVGSGDVSQAQFRGDGAISKPASAVSHRTGKSFWKQASDHGVAISALNVPFSFPPEDIPLGGTLSGLGTPDLRGTNSTFTLFSTEVSEAEAKKGVAGGRLVSLTGAGPTFQAAFDGPRGPNRIKSTAAVSFTLEDDGVRITLGGQEALVKKGAWSDWFEYLFQVTDRHQVRGIGRFYVGSLEPLSVFMYPPNMHPDAPWIPFTSPKGLSAELHQKYGLFKTVGWTHDTNALNSEKLDDVPWLQDTFYAMDKLVEIGLGELTGDHDLFIWVETATDRVAHMLVRATDKKSPRYEADLVQRLGGDPILDRKSVV